MKAASMVPGTAQVFRRGQEWCHLQDHTSRFRLLLPSFQGCQGHLHGTRQDDRCRGLQNKDAESTRVQNSWATERGLLCADSQREGHVTVVGDWGNRSRSSQRNTPGAGCGFQPWLRWLNFMKLGKFHRRTEFLHVSIGTTNVQLAGFLWWPNQNPQESN